MLKEQLVVKPVQKPRPVTSQVIIEKVDDSRCNGVAKYARAIGNLRQIGIKLDDLSAFTTEPTAVTFPMQSLRWDVYARRDLSPEDLHDRFLVLCNEGGYDNMLVTLSGEERKRQQLQQAAEQRRVTPAPGIPLIIPKASGARDEKILKK